MKHNVVAAVIIAVGFIAMNAAGISFLTVKRSELPGSINTWKPGRLLW